MNTHTDNHLAFPTLRQGKGVRHQGSRYDFIYVKLYKGDTEANRRKQGSGCRGQVEGWPQGTSGVTEGSTPGLWWCLPGWTHLSKPTKHTLLLHGTRPRDLWKQTSCTSLPPFSACCAGEVLPQATQLEGVGEVCSLPSTSMQGFSAVER